MLNSENVKEIITRFSNLPTMTYKLKRESKTEIIYGIDYKTFHASLFYNKVYNTISAKIVSYTGDILTPDNLTTMTTFVRCINDIVDHIQRSINIITESEEVIS